MTAAHEEYSQSLRWYCPTLNLWNLLSWPFYFEVTSVNTLVVYRVARVIVMTNEMDLHYFQELYHKHLK